MWIFSYSVEKIKLSEKNKVDTIIDIPALQDTSEIYNQTTHKPQKRRIDKTQKTPETKGLTEQTTKNKNLDKKHDNAPEPEKKETTQEITNQDNTNKEDNPISLISTEDYYLADTGSIVSTVCNPNILQKYKSPSSNKTQFRSATSHPASAKGEGYINFSLSNSTATLPVLTQHI